MVLERVCCDKPLLKKSLLEFLLYYSSTMVYFSCCILSCCKFQARLTYAWNNSISDYFCINYFYFTSTLPQCASVSDKHMSHKPKNPSPQKPNDVITQMKSILLLSCWVVPALAITRSKRTSTTTSTTTSTSTTTRSTSM